jgi:hypothetical protein
MAHYKTVLGSKLASEGVMYCSNLESLTWQMGMTRIYIYIFLQHAVFTEPTFAQVGCEFSSAKSLKGARRFWVEVHGVATHLACNGALVALGMPLVGG